MQFRVKGSSFFQVLIQKYSKSSEMDKVWDRHQDTKVDTDTMASKWAEIWMATAKDRYWKPDLTEAEAGCDL